MVPYVPPPRPAPPLSREAVDGVRASVAAARGTPVPAGSASLVSQEALSEASEGSWKDVPVAELLRRLAQPYRPAVESLRSFERRLLRAQASLYSRQVSFDAAAAADNLETARLMDRYAGSSGAEALRQDVGRAADLDSENSLADDTLARLLKVQALLRSQAGEAPVPPTPHEERTGGRYGRGGEGRREIRERSEEDRGSLGGVAAPKLLRISAPRNVSFQLSPQIDVDASSPAREKEGIDASYIPKGFVSELVESITKAQQGRARSTIQLKPDVPGLPCRTLTTTSRRSLTSSTTCATSRTMGTAWQT